jgi:hypothetical protein
LVLRQYIPVSQIIKAEPITEGLPKNRYGFTVHTQQRRFILTTDSVELRDRWVQAINRERENYLRSAGSTT